MPTTPISRQSSTIGVIAVCDSYVGQADVRLPIGISGNYHVFVETDEVNAVFEFFSKNNNIGESDFPIAVTLTDYADLEAADVAASRNAVSGQSATITWQVTNQGAGVTGDGTPDGTVGSWTDQIVLSQDAVFGNADDVVVANVPCGFARRRRVV